jgi:uncharacterized protein DUF6282
MPLRIENAIDLHCHFGPDTIGALSEGPPPDFIIEAGITMEDMQHSVTGFEAAREAFESGHRAIVLKSHSFCSAQLAASIECELPGFKVFGGGCTDYASGGLSVETVESALLLGAKIIWLPTVNSCQDMSHRHPAKHWRQDGIPVIDGEGNPSKLVQDIAALTRQYGAALATGHTTAAEHYAVVKAFARDGKVLVTHAGDEMAGPQLSPAQARELADLGALIELTAQSCIKVFSHAPKSAKQMAGIIETIGHERCTLSSDYGWAKIVPRPAPGFREFLERLWDVGVSEAQLTRMAATNPAQLLSLA